MRLIFINHCHPDMPHVCGLRFGRFADAMAARGHQVVLLTENYPRDATTVTAAQLTDGLATHDWSTPYVLACSLIGHENARRAREGRLATPWRQIAIGRSYLINNGMFADWQSGAGDYLPVLVSEFRPDAIWATFGNTDAWAIARALARRAGCPWVADFKDNWTAFIPPGLRNLMAHRFRDGAHMTVLSEGHCDEADPWFSVMKTVIYSGVDAIDFKPVDSAVFRITLAGSIYDRDRLTALVSGIEKWLASDARAKVDFRYAGNDTEMAMAATASLDGKCRRTMLGYIDNASLAEIQAASNVNLYVHNERCIFHHKALELVAAGRPIISYPDETCETRNVAAEVGASLFVCADPQEVTDALKVIAEGVLPVPAPENLKTFTWAHRAEALEAVFERVTGGWS